MSYFEPTSNEYTISLSADEHGFIGRECPNTDCEGYFKIQNGTGLIGEQLPMHCPYCGTSAPQDHFHTKAQIEYAQSVLLNQLTGQFIRDLKSLEFDRKPSGGFGIGVSLKVTGNPTPIHNYRESELETEIVCDSCTLRYTIFGVFGFCPDCAVHNSLQILNTNFVLIARTLILADTQETEIRQKLVENCLEDCISAFDGYGRELCRVQAAKSSNALATAKISFQNLEDSRRECRRLFGVDIATAVDTEEWQAALNSFQKRHLLAHSLGVVDKKYLDRSGDTEAVIGRKIQITSSEVQALLRILSSLGTFMSEEFPKGNP